MQTPRLCIDGRAASDFGHEGIIAQELIDQLVSAQGDPGGSAWVEKKRTVLLTHKKQVFAGQLKRFDTGKKIGGSLFYSAWERNFVENARVTAFHRFRPADSLNPLHPDCELLTTVIPARSRLVPLTKKQIRQRFVVPSAFDKILLESLGCPSDCIRIVAPGVRRYVHHAEKFIRNQSGQFLIVADEAPTIPVPSLQRLLEGQFPKIPVKLWDMRRTDAVDWVAELKNTSAVFYLNSRPFDWPLLALEALFFAIPVIFSRKNGALSTLITQTPLQLESFMAELHDPTSLDGAATLAQRELEGLGIFRPWAMAIRYGELYEEFNSEYKLN